MKILNMTVQSIVHELICIVGIVALASLPFLPSPGLAQEDAPAKPKTPRMTCGKCAEGYVTTGRTTDAKICPDDDHTLVSCAPAGSQAQMPVCGSCPEGYVEMGRSLVPSLCGNADGGLRTQCQLPKMEGGMPDPTQGGRRCPPDCAGSLPFGSTPGDIPQTGKVPSVQENK